MDKKDTLVFVTNDKWLREGGVLDPSDSEAIDNASSSKNGVSYTIQFMTPVQMLELMKEQEPEKFEQFKQNLEKDLEKTLSMAELGKLAITMDETKRHFDARIGLRLTDEQAGHIRRLRVVEHYSWRAIARWAWPMFKFWQPESNQVAGMSLCEFSALKFTEDYEKPPWN